MFKSKIGHQFPNSSLFPFLNIKVTTLLVSALRNLLVAIGCNKGFEIDLSYNMLEYNKKLKHNIIQTRGFASY